MQRAQDKIAQMQARAGAVDELLASGTLTDLSGSSDPIQAELDKTAAASQVELELAQMKGELNPPAAAPSGELGGRGSGRRRAGRRRGRARRAAGGSSRPLQPRRRPSDPFSLGRRASAS